MRILTLLLFLVSVGVILAEPQFTYQLDAARAAGVQAYTVQHRDFETKYLALARSHEPGKDTIRPWMVILDNTSPEVIASVVILYSHHMADGTVVMGGVVAKRNPFVGGQMLPGQKIAFFPHNGGAFPSGTTRVSPAAITALGDVANKSTAVDISIDSITLENGTIFGPDTGGMGKRFVLERQAFQKIQQEYRAASDRAAYVDELSKLLPQVGADGSNPFTDLSNPVAVEQEIRRRLGRSLQFTSEENRDGAITDIVTRLNKFTKGVSK